MYTSIVNFLQNPWPLTQPTDNPWAATRAYDRSQVSRGIRRKLKTFVDAVATSKLAKERLENYMRTSARRRLKEKLRVPMSAYLKDEYFDLGTFGGPAGTHPSLEQLVDGLYQHALRHVSDPEATWEEAAGTKKNTDRSFDVVIRSLRANDPKVLEEIHRLLAQDISDPEAWEVFGDLERKRTRVSERVGRRRNGWTLGSGTSGPTRPWKRGMGPANGRGPWGAD